MFGLSWGQIIIIVLVGLFVVGPERIPTATTWVMQSLRKVRTMAAGAQSELRSQVGPELDELRRQVADLQSLKEFKELRALRDLNPRTIIGKNILGDEFSGGITGFLGLNGDVGAGADGAGSNGAGADGAGLDGAGLDGAGLDGAGSDGAGLDGAGSNGAGSNGAGSVTPRRFDRMLVPGERPPFDDEGT